MRRKTILKKVLSIMLVLTMTIPSVYFGEFVSDNSVDEVRAETVESTFVGYEWAEKAEINTDGRVPVWTADGKEDYLFAGWFAGEELNSSASSEANAAGARFVHKDVLNVLVQGTAKITDENSEFYNQYALRFISSVDSDDYLNAGFQIQLENGDVMKSETTTSYGRIDSTVIVNGEKKTYDYSPKIVDSKSDAFITAKLGIDDSNSQIRVRAYWTTKDGTRVFGEDRIVCLADGSSANIIDAHVDLEENQTLDTTTADKTYDVKNGDETVGTATVLNSNNVKITLTGTKTDLDSLTKLDLYDDSTKIGETLYRNLNTSYAANGADTSWYDVSKAEGETEFIVATDADMYGFAQLSKETGVNFSGQTVNIVSDISLNTGSASEWETTAPSNTWTMVGTEKQPFAGTFNGNEHTISGVYVNASANYAGFFARLSPVAAVNDLQLTNSYIKSSAQYVGSIFGRNYSGVVVIEDCLVTKAINVAETATDRYASIVGYTNATTTITDCYGVDELYYGSGVTISESSAKVTEDAIVGTVDSVKATLSGLSFDLYWTLVEDSTPILTSFTDKELDTSWYDTAEGTAADPYVISTAEDLYGVAKLSVEGETFEGKTLTLVNDIVLNEGTASEWANAAPSKGWYPIQNFKGTFDGGSKTISGLYIKNESSNKNYGLFALVDGENAEIKNLKITNSYVSSTGAQVGSIVGELKQGTLSTIGADEFVIVESTTESNEAQVGGLVGYVSGTGAIDNCWFGGKVQVTGAKARDVAGFVGFNHNTDYTATLEFERCVFNGTWFKGTTNNGETALYAFVGLNLNHETDTTLMNKVTGVNSCSIQGLGSLKNYPNDDEESVISVTQIGWVTVDSVKSWVEVPDNVLNTDEENHWNIIAGYYPCLTAFDVSQKITEKTASKVSDLVYPTTTYGTQGGWISDDMYLYQAFMSASDTDEEAEFIVKYNVQTGKPEFSTQNTANAKILNHANDMTFDGEYFVVCHGVGDTFKLSRFKEESGTLVYYDSIDLAPMIQAEDVLGIYSIDYNAQRECYVVGISQGQRFMILDKNFNKVRECNPTNLPTYLTRGFTTQGVACDENSIYFVLHKSNVIVQYDWNGNFERVIGLGGITGEPENISIVDGVAYVMVYSASSSQTAAVYSVDLTE